MSRVIIIKNGGSTYNNDVSKEDDIKNNEDDELKNVSYFDNHAIAALHPSNKKQGCKVHYYPNRKVLSCTLL